MREVKHISAEFRIDQLSEMKFSVARIMAGVMNFPMSCFSRESWKMKRIIFKACIFESSSSDAFLARSIRKDSVVLRRTG